MEVRLARLAREHDRVVIGYLARAADEAECANNVRAVDWRDAGCSKRRTNVKIGSDCRCTRSTDRRWRRSRCRCGCRSWRGSWSWGWICLRWLGLDRHKGGTVRLDVRLAAGKQGKQERRRKRRTVRQHWNVWPPTGRVVLGTSRTAPGLGSIHYLMWKEGGIVGRAETILASDELQFGRRVTR